MVGGPSWPRCARPSAPGPVRRALYPGCQSDVEETFYAPLLVLIDRADTVTPARYCEKMKRRQPPAAPELTLVVPPRAPHTFDMPLPTAASSGCGSVSIRMR